MLKFIKMKQHEGYLLYYSVLFVVIVVLTVIKKSVLRIEVRDKKNLRKARVCTFCTNESWAKFLIRQMMLLRLLMTTKSFKKDGKLQVHFGPMRYHLRAACIAAKKH